MLGTYEIKNVFVYNIIQKIQKYANNAVSWLLQSLSYIPKTLLLLKESPNDHWLVCAYI